MFVLFPEISNYFNCNSTIENKDPIFNIPYLIPISCDLETYLVGVNDFSSIIEFDYAYQHRPLYILYIKVLYTVLNIIIQNQLILNFSSFLLGHILIVSLSVFIFIKTLEIIKISKNNYKFIFLIAILFLINPIIKFGLFDSSHQSLILLQFSISFYFLRRKITNDMLIYFYAFLIGVISLANSAMLLTILFLIFHKYKKLNNILSNFYKLIIIGFFLIAPSLIWNLYISSQGYTPYNSSIQYWYQFVWIYGYIFGDFEYINFNYDFDEYFCMSIPLFLKCYISDFLKTLIYLSLPIFVSIMNLNILRKNSERKVLDLYKDLFLIFIILFSFWAFIGWYPPLRFNLYSVGFLVTFLLSIQFISLPWRKIVLPEGAAIFLYYLFLNHWNYLDVINFNFGILVSYIIILLVLFNFISFKNKLI